MEGSHCDGVMVRSIPLVLLLFPILCNLVCVWSIPGWKYQVSTGPIKNAYPVKLELAITAWAGIIAFVAGLTFGFAGKLAARTAAL